MAEIISTLENRNGDTIYPIAGGLINDSITNAMLKDNSVTTAKIADKAVTPAKIDTVKSATGVTNTGYPNNQGYIPDMSFLSYWDGSYNGTTSNITKLGSNAVKTANITDLNVTTAKIANSAVTPAKMSGVDTVLYNNTTGSNGTITLSSSAANFNYLKIFYRDNDSAYSSVIVYSPNGKRVNLMCFAASAGADAMYMKARDIYINGTSIATYQNQYSEVTFTKNPGISNAANNRIYITRVVGSYFA